jgi:DNA-binding winged helix-turn-helix (wHTH) protein
MGHIDHRIFQFDRFELDLKRGCLRTNDREIDLRPKALEVLHYLVRNANRLVPKQELFEAVWPNVTVSDDSLVQCIRELRQKLGDEDRRLIKTVARRGYLLDARITIHERPSSDELMVRPPEAPQEAPTKRDMRRLPAIVAQKLGFWGAATACFIFVAVGTSYLLGLPQSKASFAPVSVTVRPPMVPHALATFRDCEDCPEMVGRVHDGFAPR